MDAIWHKPDRTHITRAEFDEKLAEIVSADRWIIDGNYSRTVELRMARCDTVFLFDLPAEVCIQGAKQRVGKERSDLPWVDTELDPNLRREIEEFPQKHLPELYTLIRKYGREKQVVVFRTRKEAEEYLRRYAKSECRM